MDVRGARSAAFCVAVLTFLLAAKGATAQRCYNTSSGCGSSFFPMTSTTPEAVRQCCVTSIGYGYSLSNIQEGCTSCIVFGFTSGTTSPRVQLNNIVVKEGGPGISVSFALLRGPVSGARSFTITSTNTSLYTPVTTDSNFLFAITSAIRYTVMVGFQGNMALKPTRTFQLTASSSNTGLNEYTVPLTVTVIDGNVLNVQFTSPVYTAVEGTDRSAILFLQRTQAIGQSLQLRVTPLTVAEALSRNIILPAQANDSSVYPASYVGDLKQFVNTPQTVTFTTVGSNEAVPVQIAIVDNGVSGPVTQFVCIVELVDPSLASTVNLTSAVAMVRIIDNYLAVVGFLTNGTSVIEGQSFNVCVAVTNPPQQLLSFDIELNILPVTAGFEAVGRNSSFLAIVGPFNNTQRSYCLQLSATADSVLQSNRILILSASLHGAAQPSLVISPNITTVTIIDNTVLVIGFSQTQYTVNKSQSYVTFNVSILGDVEIQGTNVGVMFSTRDGTARAGRDYDANTQLLVFNSTVTQVPINVNIKDDGMFKYTEYFGASLTLQSARGFEQLITINPSQANVTIIDDVDVLVIGFDPAVYSANENDGSVSITLKVLQGSLAVAVSVRVFTGNGTATSGTDYVATSQSVVFDSSSTNHTVTIQLVNKLVSGPPKLFSVGLLVETPEAKGRVTLSPSVANVTILNTNVAVIGFIPSVYTVRKSEGSVAMVVGVVQGQLGAPVTVTLSTYSGTATAGVDFTQTTLPLVFNSTVTQVPITVNIKDDGMFKYTEYFGASLILQSARGFEQLITINPSQANVTIIDDVDVLVIGFDPAVYSANENDGSVSITLKVLQGSLAVAVSVHVFTGNGTATSGTDYVATSQSVVFDSRSTNHTVTIQLVNKLVSGPPKIFSVGLLVETPEAKGRVTLSPSVANVTILNTNVAVIGFIPSVYTVRKSEGSVVMVVGVVQGQLGAPVTVTLSTYSGTATAGVDFTQTTLPLVFNSTVTQVPITVNIKDDGMFKYTEYFGASLTLQSARGFEQLITINPSQANVTIIDDVDVLVIGFDPAVYSANENDGSVSITLKVLQGSLAVAVSVRVFTGNGTATSGTDYVATSQSVVFDSSSTNHTVTVQLVNNLVSGPPKLFSVGLLVETPEAKGRVTLSPSVANVTINGVLQVAKVNDSMIADPLFTVPLNVHSSAFPDLSLCYEIHGQAGSYLNLVSDSCTSVNAHYQYASPDHVSVNIIDSIAVRAVDRAGLCVDIEVDVDCGVTVGGVPTQLYSLNEIYVRGYGNSSVRVSVPNCNHQQLVMWVLCQVRIIRDQVTGEQFSAKMQKFVITRGLSLGQNSHGLIAQFWGLDATVALYNGPYTVLPPPNSAYYVLTMQSGDKSRSVLGSMYRYTWERLGGPCLYAGDNEGGWMVGGNIQNNLIDGLQNDYIVASAFETNYMFSRFIQSCPDAVR